MHQINRQRSFTGAAQQLLVWKKLDYQRMPEKEKRQLQQEIQLLQTLEHPHVVKYVGRIHDRASSHIYILMEYCDGGDLSQFIDHTVRKGFPLPEDTILLWFSQLVDALHYCHSLPSGRVFHRDIKPQNVLICENYKKVKLGDFGLAKMLKPQQLMAQTHVGTPYYMSPEVLNRSAYDAKSDIWSLGCLLFEMAMGKSPHCKAKTLENLKHLVDQGTVEKLPPIYSHELFNLIVWMLSKNPADRPSTEDLKKSLAFRLGCFIGLAELTTEVHEKSKLTEASNVKLRKELAATAEKVKELEEQLVAAATTRKQNRVGDENRDHQTKIGSDNVNSQPRSRQASISRGLSLDPPQPASSQSPPGHFAKPLESWKSRYTPGVVLQRPACTRFPSSRYSYENWSAGSSELHHNQTPQRRMKGDRPPLRPPSEHKAKSPFSTPLREARRLSERLPPQRYSAGSKVEWERKL